MYGLDVCVPTTCEPSWTNTLSLAGLPRGPKTLVVSATDVFGHQASIERALLYDQPPKFEVLLPLDETVVGPRVPIAFTCSDDGPEPCLVRVMQGTTKLLETRGSGRAELWLPHLEGMVTLLEFQFYDSIGQGVGTLRKVFVISNPRLERLQTIPGFVSDVSATAALYRIDTPQGVQLRQRQHHTGEDTLLWQFSAGDPSLLSASWSPRGVVIGTGGRSGLMDQLWELRDGRLDRLTPAGPIGSLVVKGRYAIWHQDGKLYRRDLEKGETVLVSSNAGNINNDVAPNGDVVFWGSGYKTFRYRDGRTTLISADPRLWEIAPRTDGQNVVYVQRTACCGDMVASIRLANELGITNLSGDFHIRDDPEPYLCGPKSIEPDWDYQVNNGWVAFTKPAGSVPMQVWLRSPTGEERQVSFFGVCSRIRSLGPNGDVIFTNGPQLFYARLGLPPLILSPPSATRVYWFDHKPLVLIGRDLFRFNPGRTHAVLDTPRVLPDGRLSFYVRAGEGQRVVVQASADLRRWENVSTNSMSTYWFGFVEPAGSPAGARFYRAVTE